MGYVTTKAKTFNIGTGALGSTVSVAHGLGEAPKAVILMWGGNTSATDAAALESYQRGGGFAIGSGAGQMYGWGSTAEHGGAAGTANEARRVQINDGVIVSVTVAGALDGKADIQSWDATNVVFEILDPFARSLRVTMICLTGTDITNVAVGTFSSPTAGTTPFTSDVTGLGFNPAGGGRSLVLFGGTAAHDTYGTLANDSTTAWGGAVDSTHRFFVYSGSRNLVATATVARRGQMDTQCFIGIPPAAPNSVDWQPDFNGWITDGFQLLHNEINATRSYKLAFLVIEGPRFAIVESTTSVTNAATVSVSGVGFKPQHGLVFSDLSSALAAANGTLTEDRMSIGSWEWDGGTGVGAQFAHGVRSDHAVSPSNVATMVEHDSCLAEVSNAGAAVGIMAATSVNSDGCVYTMTDGTTAAEIFQTVFIGAAPASGGALLPPNRIITMPKRAPQRASRW